MPAINPARLRIQSAELAELFDRPAAFVHALHELLELYADRTRRPGLTGAPPPLLEAYKVPTPVLRRILIELDPLIQQDQQAGFDLCDALWSESYLEFRSLAASLLGKLNPENPEPILERVVRWTGPKTESRLIELLLTAGLSRMREQLPERYLQQLEAWLVSEDVFTRQLGLRALHASLQAQPVHNLPVLFRLLGLLVREAPGQLRPDLLAVLRDLAARSPQETAYFLRQNLMIKSDNPGTAWLIRNSLRSFPPDQQVSLRAALRAAAE